MYLKNSPLKIPIILFFLSTAFFLINIQFPRGASFDEFHYVPSANQILTWKTNQNWEHPPLGKMILAVSIWLFGDRPFGWRFLSAVFGGITLAGMYTLALNLFRSKKAALFVAVVTLSNNLLFVQARIGMLDSYMIGFLIWALAFFADSWRIEGASQTATVTLWARTGILLGLTIACKWFGIIPWLGILGLILLVRTLQSWRVFFDTPRQTDWYSQKLWQGITFQDIAVCFIFLPLGVYALTYIPLFLTPGGPRSLSELIQAQITMYGGQLRVISNHPYMSYPLDWPLLRRPIWYSFDKEGKDSIRGVLMIGNPLIMWSGMLALIYCLRALVHQRARSAFFIIYFYVLFYGCWFFIPRRIQFYYYYYPAGMMLSLALAYVFFRNKDFATWPRKVYLGLCISLFILFYPILAALKLPSESFRAWMLFKSWI